MYSLDLMFKNNKENFKPHDFHIHQHQIKFGENYDNKNKSIAKNKLLESA